MNKKSPFTYARLTTQGLTLSDALSPPEQSARVRSESSLRPEQIRQSRRYPCSTGGWQVTRALV